MAGSPIKVSAIQYTYMLQRELCTGEKLVAANGRCVVSTLNSSTKLILDISLVLFTAILSTVGFSFLHFVVQYSSCC